VALAMPEIDDQVVPSLEFSQEYAGAGLPWAITENVTTEPSMTVTLVGCVVKLGFMAKGAVSVLVPPPPQENINKLPATTSMKAGRVRLFMGSLIGISNGWCDRSEVWPNSGSGAGSTASVIHE
jgi:hypothetical protein